jgi:GNAT superfamily N-acetyltransferase
VIRTARVEDVAFLPEIERAAGAVFREVGMAAIADDEPLPASELLAYQRAGRAWVATEEFDHPVAYLLLDIVDDAAHIEQVSVHPDQARRGLGRALIEAAEAWARRHELPGLTLTTFADVPWNAPYYSRLGFSVVAEDALSPGLRRLRAHEAELGLNAWPRVVMRREVEPTESRRPDRSG